VGLNGGQHISGRVWEVESVEQGGLVLVCLDASISM
jgi:hypothetical protein